MRTTVLLLVATIVYVAPAWGSYAITDLGELHPEAPAGATLGSVALGISNGELVCGASVDSGGVTQGFRWSSSDGMNTLSGSIFGEGFGSAISRNGVITGSVLTADGVAPAYWSSPNSLVTLGGLGGPHAYALDLNDEGAIVGYATDVDGFEHAVRWNAGIPTDLGTLPGGFTSHANAINNFGTIVGFSTTSTGRSHAVLWLGAVTDLGTLGGLSSEATDINNAGEVVGISDSPGRVPTAFYWSPTTGMRELTRLPGASRTRAAAINVHGQIVGSCDTNPLGPGGGVTHAVIWTREGAVADLNALLDNASGWLLLEANGINDRGYIVGVGINPLGHRRAFLLTPSEVTSVDQALPDLQPYVCVASNPSGPLVRFLTFSPGNIRRSRILISDVSGRLVRRIQADLSAPGSDTVTWNGRSDSGVMVAAGIYYYRIECDGRRMPPRKFVVIK